MSYNQFVGEQYDNRYLAYVGYDKFAQWSDPNSYFFSTQNMEALRKEIMERLKPTGQNIRVTDEVLSNVMSNIASNNNPVIGDIHTRFVVPNARARDDLASFNEQVITVIVNTIMDEYETTKLNQRLSIWSTVYGNFNPEGLRAHSKIKYKENDYIKGVFMENY